MKFQPSRGLRLSQCRVLEHRLFLVDLAPSPAYTELSWAPVAPEDALMGKGLASTATFRGLPRNNTDFGEHWVTLAVVDPWWSFVWGVFAPGETPTYPQVQAFQSQRYEVFFPGCNGSVGDPWNCMTFANNHPGEPTTPNWFYYYQQAEGGADYAYGCSEGRSYSLAGVRGSVRLCDSAYSGGLYLQTIVIDGQLEVTGESAFVRYYPEFLGVLAHERDHANNQTSAGPPVDADNDSLFNQMELNVCRTNPNNACSAAGVFLDRCPPFDDGEFYAGGPVEQSAIEGADTSTDWASPGSNHGR